MLLLDLLEKQNYIEFYHNGKYKIHTNNLLSSPLLIKQICVSLFNYFIKINKKVTLLPANIESLVYAQTLSILFNLPIIIYKDNELHGTNLNTNNIIIINTILSFNSTLQIESLKKKNKFI